MHWHAGWGDAKCMSKMHVVISNGDLQIASRGHAIWNSLQHPKIEWIAA
jgi:hypothetical protein